MLSSADTQSILIVDDNPTNLEVLSESLSEEGFQVAVAIDGESALEQVSYHPPSLILLDVMMPGIDGFETCVRLKANPETQDIPVIFMTALSDTDKKVKGLSLGAVDYITKPFEYEEVRARVRVHLKVENLTKTLQHQNQQLEIRVEQRTKALSDALKKLQLTQVELIQREKLSALGQLVAGIAHEINNPINFIHGNIEHASNYTHDLLEIVNLYQQSCPALSPEIQAQIDDIDVDFLSEDLPKLIRSMQVGTDRIRSIVLSLRIFSRLDEAEIKDVDLHEGIDSTLMILNSRLKAQSTRADILVVKEYGDLPQVKCYPGQLNQVFMNILSNAIDALEEQYAKNSLRDDTDSSWHPEIKIRTEQCDAEKVSIHIADNGMGIPEALQQKIFDPFFTTKAVGKGTGLGMSISHEIVTEKHHGTLSVCTLSPHGTQFTITIPTFQNGPKLNAFN